MIDVGRHLHRSDATPTCISAIVLLLILACSSDERDRVVHTGTVLPVKLVRVIEADVPFILSDSMVYGTPFAAGKTFLYAFDRTAGRMVQMDSEFRMVRTFGEEGEAAGQFSKRVRQVLVGDRIVIAIDRGRMRAVIYNHEGRHIGDKRLDQISLSRMPFTWDEDTSRLCQLLPYSAEEGGAYVASIDPFSRIPWSGKTRLVLLRSADWRLAAYSSLVAVRKGILHIVDNYIATTPVKDIHYHVYSISQGDVISDIGMLDTDLQVTLTRGYDRMYWTRYERSGPRIGMVAFPFLHLWLLGDHVLVSFIDSRFLVEAESPVVLATDSITGATNTVDTSFLGSLQIAIASGAVDSMAYFFYWASGKPRFLSARLQFPD